MSRFVAKDRAFIIVSLLWIAGLTLAPALGSALMAFWVTAALIAANAGYSLWIITRQRRLLVALNCLQIVLFGFLNWQLCQAFGPEHFYFDREPWFLDWIEFTAAHVVRAADLLDAVDELGIVIQNISHGSISAGIILVLMHLTVDVFLIGLVLRCVSRWWQDPPRETYLARGRREFGWLLLTMAVFVFIAIALQMRPIDWLLWPLDNLLRLLDVGDTMQIFGWKLHGVESNGITMTLALAFRVCAGVWMARFVLFGRLLLMRTWGLGLDELIELLDDADAKVRRGAAEGLGRSGPAAVVAVHSLLAALRDFDAGVRRAAIEAIGQMGPEARPAVAQLVEIAWLDDCELRLAALDALRRIGPAAQNAVHDLACLLKAGNTETRRAAACTLEAIAPGVVRRLKECVEESGSGPAVGAWRKLTKLHRRKRRRGTRKDRCAAAWQRCLDAAARRREMERSIRLHLDELLKNGFFDQERLLDDIRQALAMRGETVEARMLVLPLLRFTIDKKLVRRKTERDGWTYHAAMAGASVTV